MIGQGWRARILADRISRVSSWLYVIGAFVNVSFICLIYLDTYLYEGRYEGNFLQYIIFVGVFLIFFVGPGLFIVATVLAVIRQFFGLQQRVLALLACSALYFTSLAFSDSEEFALFLPGGLIPLAIAVWQLSAERRSPYWR